MRNVTLNWELMQVLSRGFLMYTMLTNPKQNKVSIIQVMSELSQSHAQHGRNIVGFCVRFHILLVASGWELLSKVWANSPNISFIPCLPKGCVTMLDPFAQLFQHLGPRTHPKIAIEFKFYGLYPSHDALEVLTLLGFVASVCTPLPTRTQQLPPVLSQQCWELLRLFAQVLSVRE